MPTPGATGGPRWILALAVALTGCQAADVARPTLKDEMLRPTVAAPPEATRPAPPPVPAAQAIFRFDLIQGIPTNQSDTLARAIGTSAKGRHLTLVRRGDPTATYRVLGYLSAVGGSDGTGGTSVTYVWDILDSGNRRLLRITGTELGGEADGDPWSGVSNQVLEAVAARTVEAIYAWVNQGAGAAGATAAATVVPPRDAI